ncbi:hypothetical protein SAMN05216355_101261 [Actinomyces ruminicola]|uniref:Uncharacterized protein n=1 Tax=Actinomyces ruminicola TaxID=332524 RepID=A0A1G9ZM68_9ACTO|nr:hypothetical protein [Actinomyces ruminicola]SDN21726.1 hypothetical protein SAMN05216355_101261 [Actinomyces ruminicola]
MTTPTLPTRASRRALARAVVVRPGDTTGDAIRRLFGTGTALRVRRAPLRYLEDPDRPGLPYCEAATAHLQAVRITPARARGPLRLSPRTPTCPPLAPPRRPYGPESPAHIPPYSASAR